MNVEKLFWDLFKASTEAEADAVLKRYDLLRNPENWDFYGGIESNFSVVENQQASPIPALIEKITNGIDAILVRKCLEAGIDPRSDQAPRSVEAAIERFFPDHKNWDLGNARRIQAERLQIIADGPRMDTSLIVFDDGEGQAPEDFKRTFLSLLRGNKNEIHFVQGKYNMGGAGAIAFCGKHRYQLIGSKRYTGDKPFGFTLIRRHPLTPDEEKKKKSTWYEFLVVGNKEIPSFNCDELDLGLFKRRFKTGTVIKLYSYDLPAGSRSVISRDLNQSINEYLFNPALPVFTIDKKERYPDDRNLERELYGLKRRLEEEDSKYVAEYFSEQISDQEIGKAKVTCYVFQPRIDKKSVKETRDTIQREFFKNNMSVLFSVNGQVHGNYTSEFITRSLKFPLLKDYLIIHVDCTAVRTEFRNELFMASRDRLKEGEESRKLRRILASLLSDGRLKEIYKARKASISVEGSDAEDLLRSVTRNLPLQEDLAKLLGQTFKLDEKRDGKLNQKDKTEPKKDDNEKPAFDPKRYPTIFSLDIKSKNDEGVPMVKLPLGGSRTIKFSTDVEDQYFDRSQEPGDLQIALLSPASNETQGGNAGQPKAIETLLDVIKSSPHNGSIRLLVRPTDDVKVGDAIKLKATLTSPHENLEQIFMVKITDPEPKAKEPKKGDDPTPQLGLPKPVMVYKEKKPDQPGLTWEDLENIGITMSHDVVVHPFVGEETLETVYINMDSTTLLSYRARLTKEETILMAEKRYLSAVYFHTLFLYTITKNRKYGIIAKSEGTEDKEVEVNEYLSDLFRSFYAQFLLNFDTSELVAVLEA